MTTAPLIDYDLPCRRCRYNLRTQPRDGRCPECGTPVAVTLGREPLRAPLVDTPQRRRRLALGCFGLAAALPAFVIANWIVRAFFHSSGIFWSIDPPYLLGPVSLLFTMSIAVICLPQRRIDGTPAYRAFRVVTFVLSLAAPLAVASWEIGYAVAPFYHYELYVKVSDCIAIGSPLALGMTMLLVASIAREWKLPDLPGPLRLFAGAWVITLLRPSQYQSWIPNVADFLPWQMREALDRLDGILTAVWVVGFAESVVLLLCTSGVLRYSARLREAALKAKDESPSTMETDPESPLPS